MLSLLLALFATINVQSKIDSVIVFTDRAVVIRKADITLSGDQTIIFTELSGMLDDNTVRIKSDGIKIGEVQIRRGYIDKPIGRVKELKDSIKIYETKEQKINNEIKVLEAKESFLNSIKLGSPELISKELENGKIAPEAWRQALTFLADELTAVKMRQIEINQDKENNKTKLDALRKELSDIQAVIENRKEITVEVEASPGTYPIELNYVIPYAVSWQPYYELRAEPSTGNVEIDYFAKISQRTAENWDRVKVTLSTAAPALSGIAPEPYPWYISLYEEALVGGRASAMARSEVMPAPAMDQMQSKSEYEVPRVETGISLQYVIPGRISLQSGEASKKVTLYQVKIPAEFEYYALPKEREIAYLKGNLKNSTDYVFLSGQANTYVGGEFTGETHIQTIAPEESTAISFGTDERVKVKRELVKTFISGGGFLSKREKKEFVYQTTIENFHSREIKIQLVEQIPVSQTKDIDVKVTKIVPPGYEEDKNLGTFTWTPKLTSQQKFIVNLEYSVEYPKGRIVNGLY